MNSLQDFSAPIDGESTVCEVDGRLHAMNFKFANVSVFTNSVEKYPEVFVSKDMLHPGKSMDEGKDLFVSVEVPFLKQLTQVYYEQGSVAAVKTVAENGSVFTSTIAKIVLAAVEKLNRLSVILNPSLHNSGIEAISKLSSADYRRNSSIRCVAWHPFLPKVAVASADDSVRIYSCDSNAVPLLKCKRQRNVTCLAWRSMSNSDIAIGCEDGIVVWNVDPQSVVTRPSTNHAIILSRAEHRPVLDVAWSPQGDVLASAAGGDSKILLWDVELDRTSSLKRPGSSGHCLSKWSPRGDKLFVSSTCCVFRVWDCETWQAEKWSILSGWVRAACWSPCGSHLLFSTSEEPMIYALSFTKTEAVFQNEVKHAQNLAVPLYDVTKVEVDGVTLGGIIRMMEWDHKGNHLAVVFKETNYIAIFRIVLQPILQIVPGFFIAGNPEEIPSTIAFVPNFEQGACLSIAWSNGRLQYFPIVYSEDYSRTSPRHKNISCNSFAFTSQFDQ